MNNHDAHDQSADEIEDHDRGLGFDLEALRNRRSILGLLGVGAAGAVGAVLLGSGGTAAAGNLLSSAASTCSEIPGETAGPYQGDGSNGPDVLAEAGIVRRDIRKSFASSSGTARGVPITLTFVVQDTATCAPVHGLAVYAWHCNREGAYSMYSQGITDQDYLRGVQITNAKGKAHFKSIFPGCYSGRWPHVHFEVYPSRYAATHGGNILATSQMALPRKPSMHVYRNAAGYEASVTNLEQISLSSDNVFGEDNGVQQLATVTGGIAKGYHAKLTVPIDV